MKGRVHYPHPWSRGKNIGEYYNYFMKMLPDGDWACFVDGDAMFTTTFYGNQIEDIIDKYPECELFTARANRIGCIWQRYGSWASNDMEEHRKVGKELFDTEYDHILDVSDVPRLKVLGGVLILISKACWKRLGGFVEQGMLGVDNDIHWKAMDAGEKVYMMTGVYLFHWYRGGKMHDKSHLA
jgi:GT2 family glycosyltransferase